jgi:hypothetical protein
MKTYNIEEIEVLYSDEHEGRCVGIAHGRSVSEDRAYMAMMAPCVLIKDMWGVIDCDPDHYEVVLHENPANAERPYAVAIPKPAYAKKY